MHVFMDGVAGDHNIVLYCGFAVIIMWFKDESKELNNKVFKTHVLDN